MKREQDEFTRKWIIANAKPEIARYAVQLTIRALHYRLVAKGMTNSMRHYKRVVSAMTQARWDGVVPFDAFVDHEREVLGSTPYTETSVDSAVEVGKQGIKEWMEFYRKNRWENQHFYVEVFIEKKALQSVFDAPCFDARVALSPCKGYPSLTHIKKAADRFITARNRGRSCVILYFGDYDPSGEDIPRSIKQTLYDLGAVVNVDRIALMKDQVIEWNLPPAPAKETDSRTRNWDGLGQVELDAVEPEKLQQLASQAINKYFDHEVYEQVLKVESKERKEYQKQLKSFVKTL